ncbi:hypothetical protein J2S13_001272 [Oikeobacillus pervagus]|uniref:Uncharacterized protein n=1 Tax=Oikeobacillus pervagus TaxID=1325931 RepID=A0AAJ1WIP9_9BACI|nr:hypothetical protein [Oikeobacillus pervagus]MDQ0214875.1 hypothetical protein [Oikeobacillus pervagus]
MKTFSPTFIIGSIRIGSVEGASCVNFGNNLPTDFTSHSKQNQGFGTIQGDHNHLQELISRLDEKDCIDVLNESKETAQPAWINQLINQKILHSDNDIVQEE